MIKYRGRLAIHFVYKDIKSKTHYISTRRNDFYTILMLKT